MRPVRDLFESLNNPMLSRVFLVLTICLLIIIAFAAIGRDKDGVRVGAVLAAICAVICVVANQSLGLGWVLVDVSFAILFASWAQTEGHSFWVWFGVAFVFGWIIALIAIKVAGWLKQRGDTYAAGGAPQPAGAT
jgi:membrane-bound ClpP family serine protease